MEEASFLLGFLAGQIILVLTGLFLLKHFVLNSLSNNSKCKPQFIQVSVSTPNDSDDAINAKEKERDSTLYLINDLLQSFFLTARFKSELVSLVQRANSLLSEKLKDENPSFPFSVDLKIRQLSLQPAPRLTRLTASRTLSNYNVEKFQAGIEWNNSPGEIKVDGEFGSFGLYLPFSSNITVNDVSLEVELAISGSFFSIIIKSVNVSFGMCNSFGHPIQVNDSGGKIEALVKHYVHVAIQSHLVNKSFMFSMK